MNATFSTTSIASLIETASDTDFTMSNHQINSFVKEAAESISKKHSFNRNNPKAYFDEIVKCIKESFQNKEGEYNFLSDKDALTSIYDTLNSALTNKDYRSESQEIVDRIKSDERFAYSFFYGNSLIPGNSIARLRSRIMSQIRKTYNVELSKDTIATIIYTHLWDEGTWGNLNSYNYISSFFQWLSSVASHEVMRYLDENGFIKVARARTCSNVRVVWKTKTPEHCKMMIDDMVHIPQFHTFLTALYVDRKSEEVIKKELCMDDEEYSLTLKASEKMLKTALLNREHSYDEFLADKNARKVLVSSEFLTLIGQTTANDVNDYTLREILGISNDDTNVDEKIENFLYKFSNELFTKDIDRFIWQGRFIKGISPVDMAEEIGVTRGYVDCRYNRLNNKFKKAVIEWWNKKTF